MKNDRNIKVSIHNLIVNTLGRKIISGEYKEGHTFADEASIGASFNASRTATREALKILKSKGLIRSRTKLGTTVQGRKHWRMLDPKVLEWCLQDPSQSHKKMSEIHDIRMAFEPVAACMAAQNRTTNDLLNIRRSLQEMAYSFDIEDKIRSDLKFHKAILTASGNSLFVGIGDLLEVGFGHMFRSGFEDHPDKTNIWLKHHGEVADAIETGDVTLSKKLMTRLLSHAQDTQFENLHNLAIKDTQSGN